MPPVPHRDPTGLLGALGEMGGTPDAAAMGMPGPPMADPSIQPQEGLPAMPGMGGVDPTQEAVWDTFPGTDPDALRDLAGQMGGNPLEAMEPLEELFQADHAKLDMMHKQQLQAIMEELGRPPDSMAQRVPAPAVGGEDMGF